ncbi:MAG: dissimilatory-type sulfite reductase subunit beta [Chlorobium sp.]|nr:dissimilatory-type sulfite reductase subunit beta [Chlorobium sp.]MCW8814636.1 dissimilatory-type sulfite reductase subunit beta [Chlorobium sp.]MCW8818832.1 dissimilatory-type sulfite reductase subunit beta [Ignavibacteriaceae bacterium]
MSSPERTWKTVESGPYPYKEGLHPVMQKNYGKWKYHEYPQPGVLKHVAESGDVIYTVRAGTPRQDSVDFIRSLCDVADKHADGYLRFTTRNNVEFMTPDAEKVQPMIDDLESRGIPVGGTGKTVSPIAHTQGWLHCDIPATDASGVVKALMDEMIEDFRGMNLPNKVKIVTQCCELNCGGQGDIAIIVKHTRPPRINHESLSEICELPKVVARCPVAAIRPTVVDGKKSLVIDEDKCMYCGACFGACPSMEINHPEHSKFAIWVAGKNSNARSKPTLMSLVAHGLPNNPPRWPEVSAVVKQILEAYREGARPWERLGEWVNRIGWKQFFEETGLTFDEDMIDNYRHARTTFNQSAHVRF